MNPYQPLKIYIAAPFPHREEALRLKSELEQHGAQVTSTWLLPEDTLTMDALNNSNVFHDKRCRAIKDYEDIDECNVFLKYKLKAWMKEPTTGGHIDETGYAHAKGKPVLIYGARENVFDYHPLTVLVTDQLPLILEHLNL